MPYTGAERAVDGEYTNLTVDGGQCAVLDTWGPKAEWRVDLGGIKNIHHVFLHHTASKSILGILSFKMIDYYLKYIDVKLIITAFSISVG